MLQGARIKQINVKPSVAGVRRFYRFKITRNGCNRMKHKKVIIKIIVFVISISCFWGCAGNTDLQQSEGSESPVEAPQACPEEIAVEETEIQHEIQIEYPFTDQEEYVLTLTSKGNSDEYELILYGKDGEVLQQISCGKLLEPIEFSFDGIAYGTWNDLEIFSSGSEKGLLFLWKDGQFSQDIIEIPRYEEVRGHAMLTVRSDENVCEKKIYLFNEPKMKTEEVRSLELHKDTGMLEIRNLLEEKSLFSGVVRMDQDGNPVNEEYFDMLLWSDTTSLWDYQGEDLIYTWVGEEPKEQVGEAEIDSFEDVQNYLFRNPGHTQEYESRQALLEDFGFESSEPVYQYFDQYGNLQLELYADESLENICGISYTYWFNSELEKIVSMNGFTLCTVTEARWSGKDPFALEAIDGTDGADYVEDFKESIMYTDEGKPDYFVVLRTTEDRPEPDQQQKVVEINFIYREDGTLFYRDYSHDSQVFGTTLCSMDSFYDEYGRVVFESGYITHGHLEYYYIYEDKEGEIVSEPAYVLCLDYNLNYVIPSMIRCR